MFNFIYYGKFDSWSFFGSSAGVPFIDLTDDGIRKNILPKIKEKGHSQVVSMKKLYSGDFKKQYLNMQKRDSAQVCEIKERYEKEGYTITYFIFIEGTGYDEEFNEEYLKLNIFAFQDFDTTEYPDDLPI